MKKIQEKNQTAQCVTCPNKHEYTSTTTNISHIHEHLMQVQYTLSDPENNEFKIASIILPLLFSWNKRFYKQKIKRGKAHLARSTKQSPYRL